MFEVTVPVCIVPDQAVIVQDVPGSRAPASRAELTMDSNQRTGMVRSRRPPGWDELSQKVKPIQSRFGCL